MYKYIIITIAIIFVSCTKEVNIKLKTANPLIVIEGNISDEPGPYTVKLSKTVSFSAANMYPPISGALVVISDNMGVVDTLSETTPGAYLTHKIVGTQGNTYTLKVLAEGKEYHAVSSMPFKVKLDSIRFEESSLPGSTAKSYAIIPLYLDPMTFGNSYRFFFSTRGVYDKTYQVSNDNNGNGSVNQQPFNSDDVEFLEGDTVNVTMRCIDENTYNYYYSLSQLSGGGPGGNATPSNPPNNITVNKALGIFSAYTTQTLRAVAR